ncbi:MAG TPA: hypothetical protein VD908_04585 [Cytophagales bacterium]|nr:hypothetical protein [Cytophagales bacterium]
MESIESKEDRIKRRVKFLIWIFMVGLTLSGLTAFPLELELGFVRDFLINQGMEHSTFFTWIEKVYSGVKETNLKYPFIAYGTDWLAFAHIVIAVAFIGPLKDPVKNIWVIEFGMIACAGIIPLAIIAGSIRSIPFYWQMIDCSFGIFGVIPLWICRKEIKKLAILTIRNS